MVICIYFGVSKEARLKTRVIFLLLLLAYSSASTAIKLGSARIIELSVIGQNVVAPDGSSLTVPNNASAVALNVTAVTPSASGFITVWPCGVARPNASNLNFVAGDVVPNGVVAPIGSNGSVCFYSSQATDLIVDVAGWFEGEAFVGATPQRLVDTRDGTGGQLGQLVADAPLVVQTTGIAATTAAGVGTTIPSSAGTVALNVTVVNPSSSGFITVYPCDAPRPLASNLNYVVGQVVANGVLAPVSSSGQVCLYSQSPTDIIVDLAGWFPSGALTGGAFTGATPNRLVDTRNGTGAPLAKLAPSGQLSVTVQGTVLSVNGNSTQVPLSASAAALNVTVVNPESAGFVTVWPCSAARPNASNLNFTAGKVVANNVIAPIGEQGNVCFFASQNTDIIVDISGYFTGESRNQFVGSTPKRFVDTRDGTGPAPASIFNPDSDGDGVLDADDAFPLDNGESIDTDQDGIGNNADRDDDGDFVFDEFDPVPLSSVNDSVGGIWIGTATSNFGYPTTSIVGVSTESGEFVLVDENTKTQYIGNFSSFGNYFFGDGFAAAGDDLTFLNGRKQIDIEVDGIIAGRSTIDAEWRTPSTGESGRVFLEYSDDHLRSSSRFKFNGRWVGYEPTNTVIDAELSFSNGLLSGVDDDGCRYSGSVAPIDQNFNVYRVVLEVSNCVFSGISANGTYSGLGALVDAVYSGGEIVADGRLVFGVNNGQFFIADSIWKAS